MPWWLARFRLPFALPFMLSSNATLEEAIDEEMRKEL
jgi:hypothetical protein